MKKKLLYICALFIFLYSCIKPMNNIEIADLLGVSEVKVKKEIVTKTLDQSIVIIEYHLPDTVSQNFIQGQRVLPTSAGYETWRRQGWFNSSIDTMNVDAYYYLNLKWDDYTQKKQEEIKGALKKKQTFFAHYDLRDFYLVQLYVYDTESNILYSISSGL
ncbi:hypothetical protein [Dysgonomonas sp. 25]|uniref:hypothetical protein n=1 Tax=Dysgonomonas sp. 25 TaxID=2302933 RepID=UPI0013D1DC5E|nr:hypothetical protein [Dysgonomonas sp. 25]NDV67886.1 hypothetical protein [Dysgonomonas sp. 25]